MRARSLARTPLVALGAAGTVALAQSTAPVALAPVDVVATTPLPGLELPLSAIPANVQTLGRPDIERAHESDVARILFRSAGVSLDNSQGNRWQQDLVYRGFIASPLLGTPQGLSVYQDGVRLNQPFGDVVDWDLVPANAISTMQLLPGSNPVFGLNTLGGAIVVQTRRGADRPGASATVQGGSFGRREASVEAGGVQGNVDGFVTANVAREDGWAEHNASRVNQLFAAAGLRRDAFDGSLSVTAADNRLEGVQTLPVGFLDRRREPYTWPDTNENRAALVNARAMFELDADTVLAATVHAQRIRSRNVSSNVNDAYEGDDDAQAFNDRSDTSQTSHGATVQLNVARTIGGASHRLAIGVSYDAGRVRFDQASQPATFADDRRAVGNGPFEPITAVSTRNRYAGAYVADSIAVDDRWSLLLAGRYNAVRIDISDRSGTAPELEGRHRYARFSPSIGVNFNPRPEIGTWLSVNEAMRAPTAMELTCADPDAPCRLPNSFLADPPLAKVVARTVEIGARGPHAHGTWSAAAFATELIDDLQFVASDAGALNAGYFRNVGRTRRAGIELAASVLVEHGSLSLRYAYTLATYRTSFSMTSPANSAADDEGRIAVQRGDRIPGIPAHVAKLVAEHAVGDRGSVIFSLAAVSARYARGDENNGDANGRVPAYVVAAVDAEYRLTRSLTLIGSVTNLFDRRYETAGAVGTNFFTGPSRSFGPAAGSAPEATQFRGPAAPIGGWLGLRYTLEQRTAS